MIVLGILLLVLALMHINGMIRSVINSVKILGSPEGQRLWLSATGKGKANVSKLVTRNITSAVLVNLLGIGILVWAAIVIFRGA